MSIFGRSALALALFLMSVSAAIPALAADNLEDLLWDLQIVPLDDAAPPPFTLEAVDGGKKSLANFLGRPVLLYFWESG